jgi:hypothetical protein
MISSEPVQGVYCSYFDDSAIELILLNQQIRLEAHKDALPLEGVGQAHALVLLLLSKSGKVVHGLGAVLPQVRLTVSLVTPKQIKSKLIHAFPDKRQRQSSCM